MPNIRKSVVKFICQSLMSFKDEFANGEMIFEHLFYNRTNDKEQLRSAMDNNKTLTLVGNPGEGKTCLMHHMFIATKKEDKFFPIILDYKYCTPRKEETLIIKFIEQMKNYFKIIHQPINKIAETTSNDNYDRHHRAIMDHLRQLPIEYIEESKKVVIFLDDLDYLEGNYINLLKTYFLPFALNPKTIIILSGRKPLINTISADHELNHAFNLNPKKIFLMRVSLKTLFESRISSLYSAKKGNTIFRWLNSFGERAKESDIINKLLRREVVTYLKQEYQDDDISEDQLDVSFGFDDNFWTSLGDVTGRNLRQIEQILPDVCGYQWNNVKNGIDYNNNFPTSFILSMYEDQNVLLDLVSTKTSNKRKKYDGNSIMQIVLEYFYEYNLINDRFYEIMNDYGISDNEANATVNKISQAPFALIDPEFIYTEGQIFRQYKINRKGKFYLDYILKDDNYYDKLSLRVTYKVTRSNRTLLINKEG